MLKASRKVSASTRPRSTTISRGFTTALCNHHLQVLDLEGERFAGDAGRFPGAVDRLVGHARLPRPVQRTSAQISRGERNHSQTQARKRSTSQHD